MKKTKAQVKAEWMAEFNSQVIKLDSKHSGKIDWNTADHFYFSGLTPSEAAHKYTDERF